MNDIGYRAGYFDFNLDLVSANREFLTYFESGELHCDHFIDFVDESEKSLLKAAARECDPERYFVFRLKKNDGSIRSNLVNFSPVNLDGKDVLLVRTEDIGELLAEKNACHFDGRRLESALGITSENVFFYDPETDVFELYEYFHDKKLVLFNQKLDDWRKQVVSQNLVPEDQITALELFCEELKGCPEKSDVTLTCAIRTKSPDAPEEITITSKRFECGGKVFSVGRFIEKDLNEKTEKSNELMEELQLDSLTKVFNKKTITEFAQSKIQANKNGHVAIVIVDLDHFKPVNDQYGHLAGDKVLIQAGKILKDIVGDSGFVGRFGGDEFMLVINDVSSSAVLRGYLRTVLSQVQQAFSNTFEDVKITSSIGAAVHPDNGKTFEELFKKADFCLYRAKDKGRNRYVFFRDDLHKAEFLRADAAKTAGIKYDCREMQEIKYMAHFIRDIDAHPGVAIPTVLNHMLEAYNLDCVSIYYGEQMKRIYHLGKEKKNMNEASYVLNEDFRQLLKDNPFLKMDFLTDFSENQYTSFYKAMSERGVQSTLHCILGTPDNIKGLVTFDRYKMPAMFAEYEVHCCNIFASCLNLQKQKIILQILEGF